MIELARSNGVYLLCLPSHTTHILQPLDVGIFKSLKASFYKACKRYLATNPGRVITPDVIASLLGEAWPESVTPMNIMSGFKKYGIYPLNPGVVTDRQLAPATALCPLQKLSSDSNHSDSSPSCASSKEMKSPQIESLSHPDTMTVSSYSEKSVARTCSVSDCADMLSDILVLPKPKPSKKKRSAVDSKKACLTDSPVLEQLKRKEEEKVEKQKQKEDEKVEKQKQKQAVKKGKTSKSTKAKKGIEASILDEEFEALQVNSDEDAESFVQCPIYGLIYDDDESMWMYCDVCNTWYDIKCALVTDDNVPDEYICRDCN